MSIGKTARRVLGPNLVPGVARAYRRIFVDLDDVAHDLGNQLPDRARVFDVGGGDGEPLNYLFALRPDISVTMIDISEELGMSVAPEFRDRVRILPGVSIRDYLAHHSEDLGEYDLIVVSDVMHHIPVAARPEFLADLRDLWEACGCGIYIKDLETTGVRARLSYWSDVYISGDKNTSLIGRRELMRSLDLVFGPGASQQTLLYRMDRPNYAVRVKGPGEIEAGSPEAGPRTD